MRAPFLKAHCPAPNHHAANACQLLPPWLHALLLLLFVLCPGSPAQGGDPDMPGLAFRDKSILLLHSYSSDYQWTRELDRGIHNVLDQLDWTNSVRVEMMDTKHILSRDYLRQLADLYAMKYGGADLDGIISTDNNALTFLNLYGSRLFPGVPIIAAGINGAEEVRREGPVRSILIEQPQYEATLRQAIAQNPEAENCFIITDATPTGQATAAAIRKIAASLDTTVDLVFLEPMPFADLEIFAAGRQKHDLIYLLPYFRDGAGANFDQGYAATRLSKVAPVPIYAAYAFQLGTGVVGGRVISGEKHGELAARTLLQLWQNEDVPAMLDATTISQLDLYDASALARFAIDKELLPTDSVLINRPRNFAQRHRQILLPLGLALLLTGALTLLYLILLTKQRIINQKQQSIIALNQEVIETQRDLVTMLSEVIETRNRGSGNHVKRVAKIARLLGEKAGLTEQELDILEAAAPLHDIGKIAIPEALLRKEGPLTEDEFALIKQHTTIGKDILQGNDRRLLTSACAIAHQHHERWDGTGYPNGLQGEQIDIFSRITMLADIYDALSTDRWYKKGWPEEKVLRYIRRETARYFDPYLVSIFIENLDAIRAIRTAYPPTQGYLMPLKQN